MKTRVCTGIVLGLVGITALLLVAFQSKDAGLAFVIEEDGIVIGTELPHSSVAAANLFGASLTEPAKADIKLRLNLTLTPKGRSAFVPTAGDGILVLNGQSYRFISTPDEALEMVGTPQGDLYLGPLTGSIDADSGREIIIIGVVFRPSTGERLFNISVGTVGQEVLFTFGEPFLSREELESLTKKRS